MPRVRRLLTLLPLLLPACGSRTMLNTGTFAVGRDASVDAPEPRTDAPSAPPEAAAPPFDAAIAPDPCPSALLAGAPRAMSQNCSTRDGRTRVRGPSNPHMTWLAPVVPQVPLGMDTQLAADASGAVYLVATKSVESSAWLARLSGETGAVDWLTPFEPVLSSLWFPAPLLLANGTVEIFGGGATGFGLDRFSVMTGADTTSTLAPGVASGNPAVGADGSLYVAYQGVPPTLNFPTSCEVSRLTADGAVVWTSTVLDLMGAMDTSGNGSTIALTADGLVIEALAVNADASPPFGDLFALDSATGATEWELPIGADFIGGPTVASDGSILLLVAPSSGFVGTPTPTTLLVVGPDGSMKNQVRLGSLDPNGAAELFGVTLDGAALIGVSASRGANDGALALVNLSASAASAIRWQWMNSSDTFPAATIAADGTIVLATGTAVEGIDPVGGSRLWSLASPAGCVRDVTLTSSGGLVVLQCDDSVFGAGD